MAGAAGDALGYEVEFMSHRAIISRFGEQGITKFTLDSNGKALVSDDTQMTLFTANGILNAERLQVELKFAVVRAYIDWYYTQIGKKNKMKSCWISEIDALHSLRAPGNTCMSALDAIARGKDPCNNSKGCGGIMRIAPIALYASVSDNFNDVKVAQLAADASECTHQHPLGFLPASLLSVLLYKIIPMSPMQVRKEIDSIVADTVSILDHIYIGKYESDKLYLKELTDKAVQLAHSNISDTDAISQLGEGWIAEETWAIALFCAIRHIDSVEDAIIASVNHNGDSDSTGSVCGNIMGTIYGYEHIRERNIFCPEGKQLEDSLELSEIILTLADDLSTGSIINKYDPIDTPQKQQWHERYYKMKPAGIGENSCTLLNVTPEWIDSLKENEIFVFGCRNSGRHLDGASNFALENFGARMGQREGRQGQSYAIPTIGGVIGLKEIELSVKTFTQYASEHPQLHFLVTPVGCGGGCRRPSEIAPMFSDAAKLANVSLPQEFWNILNRY